MSRYSELHVISNRYETPLLVPLLKLLNSLTPLLFSNFFTGLKSMNEFNIKFSISPSNFSIPRNLNDLTSLQTPRNTRSLSVVTFARPPTRSSLKIAGHSFRYASPHLWNQLPHLLRQPHLDLPIPDSFLLQDYFTSHMSFSPLLSSIAPSFFHSKLKTVLFLRSYLTWTSGTSAD